MHGLEADYRPLLWAPLILMGSVLWAPALYMVSSWYALGSRVGAHISGPKESPWTSGLNNPSGSCSLLGI